MNIAQLVISIPLFMVLAFGIGFMLNMLVKTTWMPIFLYVGLVIYLLVGVEGAIKVVDMVILSSGMAGAVLSGTTIRMLRQRGFRMF